MAINPYTTAAEYTYTPIPFREMMYAGAAADKRTSTLLSEAEKYNSTLPHWEGDDKAAKTLWENKEKAKQDLIDGIYSNPGNYASSSRELMSLARQETKVGGMESELNKRLEQANAYKAQVKESGWEGEFAQYPLNTLDGNSFEKSYDIDLGTSGDVSGINIPKYMSGEDMQGAMNTMLAQMKSKLLATYDEKEVEAMTKTQLVNAYGTLNGNSKEEIASSMGLLMSDDLINAAQHMSDSKVYAESRSKFDNEEEAEEWFNNNRINESDFMDWKTSTPKNTHLGRMMEGLSTLASNNKLNIKEGKKSSGSSAIAKQQAKNYKEGQPSITANSWKITNPKTPLAVYDQLYGTEGKPGIIDQIDIAEQKMKESKGNNSQDYVSAKTSLNILEAKRANMQTILDAYQDKLYNTNKDWKELQDFEDSKDSVVLDGISNANIADPDQPRKSDGTTDTFLDAIEAINNDRTLYEYPETGSQSSSRVVHSAIGEGVWKTKHAALTDDQKTYLDNLAQYHLDVNDGNEEIRDILSDETDELIKEYEGKLGTIRTRRIPISHKASDGQVLNEKSQAKYKWGETMRLGIQGYTVLNASGNPMTSDQDAIKKFVKETAGVFNRDGVLKENTLEFIGVTGPAIKDAEGQINSPMLHYRLHKKIGKNGEPITEDFYAIPNEQDAAEVWSKIAEDYSINPLSGKGGSENKKAANQVIEDVGNYNNLIGVQDQIGWNIFNNQFPSNPVKGKEKNFKINIGGETIASKRYAPQGGEIDFTSIDPEEIILSVTDQGVVRVAFDDPNNPGITQTDSFGGGLIDNSDSWKAAVAHILSLQKFTQNTQKIAAQTLSKYPGKDSYLDDEAVKYAMNNSVPMVQDILGSDVSTDSREFALELRVFMEKVYQQMRKENTSAVSGSKGEN
tara:strand:+ start:14861 stop:17578 length:2718 start_codon:yes stop_codon:yes gene_type:complete